VFFILTLIIAGIVVFIKSIIRGFKKAWKDSANREEWMGFDHAD
jgi:hypothetical protein